MSLTITEITNIIDDCLQEGYRIGIACDKEVARILYEYIDDYEMNELHNDLSEHTSFEHINSDYVIVIDCSGENFEYFIEYYQLNNKLPIILDAFYWIGSKFSMFNPLTVKAKAFIQCGDVEVKDEELALIFGFDVHEDYEIEESNEQCSEYVDDEEKYYQAYKDYYGDIEEEDEEAHCDCESCNKPDDNNLIDEFVDSIIKTQGCPDCIIELATSFASKMKTQGWNDCIRCFDLDNCKDE